MEELIHMQELVLINEESRQWIRETEDAIAAGDRELALRCLRKATGVAFLSKERHPDSQAGEDVLNFFWLVSLYGDVRLARDLLALSDHQVAIAERHGESGGGWRHDQIMNLEADIAICKRIREAVAVTPGSPQAMIAKGLGVENSRVARLAARLCDAQEIVAANRNGRVYLWPANDAGAPSKSERRPVNEELDEQYRMEPIEDRPVSTGAEWERRRIELLSDIDMARQQPSSSLTILDFIGAGTDLYIWGGPAVIFDKEDNAIGYGHFDLESFHAAVQAPYREQALRPQRKTWSRNPARHTWVALEMRDPTGDPILREVHEGAPGALPVTVITTPRRNTDPARARRHRHIWLLDTPAANHASGDDTARQEVALGRAAATTLASSGLKTDVVFPRWTERQWHTRMQTGEILETGEIPWTIENLEPIRNTQADEHIQAWVLGPDRSEALRQASNAIANGEVWHPHPDLCLISRDGFRLRLEIGAIPGRDGGMTGKGGWRATWVETAPVETVTCGLVEPKRMSLTQLVDERIQLG